MKISRKSITVAALAILTSVLISLWVNELDYMRTRNIGLFIGLQTTLVLASLFLMSGVIGKYNMAVRFVTYVFLGYASSIATELMWQLGSPEYLSNLIANVSRIELMSVVFLALMPGLTLGWVQALILAAVIEKQKKQSY